MSDSGKPAVRAPGDKPGSVALVQGMFVAVGLIAVAWYIGAAVLFVGFSDYNKAGRTVEFWRLAAALVLIALCTLGAAAGLSSRRPREGWWFGIVGVLVVALGGAAIIHSPVRTHQTDLIPELVWGLAVLAVAGIVLAALLAPATRSWVEHPSPAAPGDEEAVLERVVAVGLSAPLQAEVERMRRVAMTRGELIMVTALSDTEAIVEMGTGRFRLTIGDDGRVKVEAA